MSLPQPAATADWLPGSGGSCASAPTLAGLPGPGGWSLGHQELALAACSTGREILIRARIAAVLRGNARLVAALLWRARMNDLDGPTRCAPAAWRRICARWGRLTA